MMQNIVIGIPIFFVILASVMLWLIILGKGKWYFKALLVPVVLYYCIIVYLSLGSLSGWSAKESLPEKFRIHWVVIEEPEKIGTDTGSIHLWLSATEETENKPINKFLYPFTSQRKTGEPRAYRMAYSQKMHESMEKTMEQLKQGKVVMGESKKSEKNKNQEKQDKGAGQPSFSQEQEFMFYELPPAKLPEKN